MDLNEKRNFAAQARVERLEAEIAAIEDNIRNTENFINTKSSTLPWVRVCEMKAHLYDLCKARDDKHRDLKRLQDMLADQTEII